MNIFIQDLWHDLRAKRMWPVAVLLVAGLIAVFFVLRKPAPEQPAADVTPTVSQVPQRSPGVQVAQEKTLESSALGVFDPKDPFKPRARTADEGSSSAPSAASSEASSQASSLSSGAPVADFGSGASAGGAGETGGGGAGETGGGGGGAPSAPQTRTRTRQYTYVIDVTFKHNGRVRKIKGMQRLEMLPSERSPQLIFMGVDSKAANAVFLVDSRLHGAGEGKCKPSASQCSLLYLGAGSEHQFLGEGGDSYAIRIDQIRRVKVEALRARRASRSKAHRAASKPQLFVPPLLVDLVDVASSGERDSGRRRSRR